MTHGCVHSPGYTVCCSLGPCRPIKQAIKELIYSRMRVHTLRVQSDPYHFSTSPFDKSGVQYIQYDISGVRAIQKLYMYDTPFVPRAARGTTTVS
eukprot:COSAG02_NODE_20587_length_824_cov_1.071724_2_plen_94_part_01